MAGDIPFVVLASAFKCFNSRPRVAGDFLIDRVQRTHTSFNSRPRVAGDFREDEPELEALVSIHARAWRATHQASDDRNPCTVSIHARAWRATLLRWSYPPVNLCFNSRPRVAGDLKAWIATAGYTVSIHARAWRATVVTTKVTLVTVFQFTPARGGRHAGASGRSCKSRFNSRPRVAGDDELASGNPMLVVSIHARAWRATYLPAIPPGQQQVSIHARAWRATRAGR